MVRKVLYVISAFMFVFVFTACSGYVQTNKKLNLLKEETVRNREMLFYLKQKNNLQ